MKQWSINIEGDYLDSFIYMGLLFLSDFDGRINVYNFDKLLNQRLDNKELEFSKIFSNEFTHNRSSDQTKEILDISLDYLEKFKTDELDAGNWTTNIHVYSKCVYFSSDFGLKKCSVDIKNGKLKQDKIITLFDDTKVYSFATSSFGRNVLCCGDEGAIYNIEENNRLKYVKDNKRNYWIDCQWYSLQKNDILSINNQEDILIQKIKLEKDIRLELDRISRIEKKLTTKQEERKNSSHLLSRIEKVNTIRQNFVSQLPNCFKEDLSHSPTMESMKYFKERWLRDFGLFFQKDDNLFLIKGKIKGNENEPIPIRTDSEITNWRIFPNATTHFNQLHIVYDDYISLNGFEIDYHPFHS